MSVRAIVSAATLAVSLAVLPGLTPRAAADAYKVDPVHSSVIFRVKHMGVGYFYGRFDELTGVINLDEKSPENTTVQLQIKADSVDTNNPKRDAHVKSPDFLNAKEFPTISFQSKQVKQATGQTLEVTGDLTLHGVTKSITVKLNRVGAGADPFGGGQRAGFETSFFIRRSDFGMNFMPQALGNDIWLLIGFEAVQRK